MWQQDRPWSQALGRFLGQWLGTPATRTCGTDDASQRRYRDTMSDAGLEVTEISHAYTDELDLDRVVGGVYSAISVQKLPPPGQRAAFAEQVRAAIAAHAPFTENVRVRMLIGRRPGVPA